MGEIEDLISKVLEEYSLSEVLERMDLTEEEVLETLIDIGLIKWVRLTAEIPLPVS